MLESIKKRRRWKQRLASVMAMAMAIMNLYVVPATAAGVNQAGGVQTISGGDYGIMLLANEQGEYAFDVTPAGNGAPGEGWSDESSGYYNFSESTEYVSKTQGIFSYYSKGTKIKIKADGSGFQLDGGFSSLSTKQAAIEIDLSSVPGGYYYLELEYKAKSTSAAANIIIGDSSSIFYTGTENWSDTQNTTKFTTILNSGKSYLLGSSAGIFITSLKLSLLEEVEVTGTISCAAGTTFPNPCEVIFTDVTKITDTELGYEHKQYKGTVNTANGTYSVQLPATSMGMQYEVSMSDPECLITTNLGTITVKKDDVPTVDFTIMKASIYELTGTYSTGLDGNEKDVTALIFEPVTPSSFEVPEVKLNNGAYTVTLEQGTSYTVRAEGVNDYEIIAPAEIKFNQNTTLDIKFQKKPTYKVTLGLGATPDLSKMNVTYIFTHEDAKAEDGKKYVYTFEDASNISLRDGNYTVSIGGDFEEIAYTINVGATLSINGAPANHAITFKEMTSWSFVAGDGDYYNKKIEGKSGTYKGLIINAEASGAKLAASPENAPIRAQFNAGTIIEVPVTGPCSVSVTAYEKGANALYTINGQPADTSAQTATVAYTGQAGTVKIEATANTYIVGISVTYPASDVEKVTQTEMPFVPKDDSDANTAADKDGNPRANVASNLVVQPVGQKLNLTQTGGSFAQAYSDTHDVTYYLFPATEDDNQLEFDLLVTEAKSTSNSAGFFGGMFTNNYVYSLGLRGGQKIRGIYSKNAQVPDGDFAGAGSPAEENIGINIPIHYVISKSGDKVNVVITFVDDNGVEQTREFSQEPMEENGSKPTKLYYGFALANVSVTITNMVYTKADGTVLYDQNNCYYPKGTIPTVSDGTVTAKASDTREYIDVSWFGVPPEDDATYVVEMSLDGGEWQELSQDVTGFTYRYTIPEGQGGNYLFRVSGQLGKPNLGGKRSNPVTMAQAVYVLGALAKPVVNISATEAQIALDWQDVADADYYEVYRYSFDEGEEASRLLTTVTASEYVDTDVIAEMPYYYNVKAVSSTNFSPLSETVWQVPTAGHTGTYVYEDEATEIVLTKKSYDTVYSSQVVLEGVVDGAGDLEAFVNGSSQASVSLGVRESFSFTLTVEQGRNDVELIFTDQNGNKTRKAYNFVYLTNYNYVVDASFTGTDGQVVDNIPTYSTVQAAVDAATSGGIILVRAGSYEEWLMVNKPNITLIGEDRESTVIHCYPGNYDSDGVAGGNGSKRCATYVQSGATGFSAENITFKNDYVYSTPDGKSNKSADAFRCDAEGATFVNVKFVSVQDTLYMDAGHQYYDKCRIEGVVDFIYSGEKARAFFNDCEIVFVYESTKTSGYVCAPKTAADATYGLTFYNCVIIGEEGCNGNGYLLARPWGPDAYITWIDCYIGKSVYKLLPYSAMSGNPYQDARFFEFGSYGPGFAINSDRRQISPSLAQEMVSDDYLGWHPSDVSGAVGESYKGSVVTNRGPLYVEQEYRPDKYAWTDGDDTGLKMYDLEGYAQSYGVSGGGLLMESNDNYYEVYTGEEFLKALTNIKQTGKDSVIELKADIALGNNEVENFATYQSSKLIDLYSAQALTHPKLMETGVTKVNLDGFHNLTIFSQEGYSILHANITMKNSSNIMIRNIKFDELWEWDEATSGDYDRNDWDYMTIDSACDGIWIDHCTFYKAYDGVIDVKNPAPVDNVTISWCEFLPGSENNVFFDQMMDDVFNHPEKYPTTYQHMVEEGMTNEQVYMYAYGQKKTHLFGQSDESTNAAGIQVTMANNLYKDSMDRMPRLRYGYSHVYNCIMDSQELLDAKDTIANADIAKKIVSNGASSTCEAQVLLENCYINGIQNALNSGNGSSPSGYINAVNSIYEMYGKTTKLEPKSNSSADSRVLVTDASSFVSALPYSGYHLYSAAVLDQILIPSAGAGKINMTVLQWEKVSYNAEYVPPDVIAPSIDVEISDTIPEDVLTDEVKAETGCDTVEELVEYLEKALLSSREAEALPLYIQSSDISVIDVVIKISKDNGITWEEVTKDNFPAEGVDIIIPYPTGTNRNSFDFVVGHLIVLGCNGQKPGTMEYFKPIKTEEGLKIHVMSASPFVIGWIRLPDPTNDDGDDDGDDDGGPVVPAPDNQVRQTASRTPRRSTGSVVDTTSPKPTTTPSTTPNNTPQVDNRNEQPANQEVVENREDGAGVVEDTLLTTSPAAASHTLRNSIIALIVAAAVAATGYFVFIFYRRKKEEQ